MAQRRMFSLKVIDTDLFLDMSPTAQNLYFHLGMRADDDGFVSNPKKIMKIVSAPDDDMKVLIAKGFIIQMATNGVSIITHWKINNLIKTDRYTETIYKEEKSKLIDKDGKYGFLYKEIKNGSKMVPEVEPQVRLGKVRLGKNIPVADATWSFEEELEKLRTGRRKDFRIIALYWKKKKWIFINQEQFNSALTRELKACKTLKGYTGEEIARAINYCIGKYPADGWTLETVFKRIQDLINTKHE